jgi:hypothetical protein
LGNTGNPKGIKFLEEVLNHGCEEKGCKEEKETLAVRGAKSPHLQGKIVETGVRSEHPFYFLRHLVRETHFVCHE